MIMREVSRNRYDMDTKLSLMIFFLVYVQRFNDEHDLEESESEDEEDNLGDTANMELLSTLRQKILFFIFFWQSFFRVSETALKYLLRFLKYLIKVISITYQCPSLQSLSDEMPLTIRTAEKCLKLNENGVIQYVVCPKCHSVYLLDDCIELKSNGKRVSKLCRHVKYPYHIHIFHYTSPCRDYF